MDGRVEICSVGSVKVIKGHWGHVVIREGIHIVVITSEEAIEAARAILKHFGET